MGMAPLTLPSDLYERWRAVRLEAPAAGEPRSEPQERWLQQIWRHQRLRRNALATLDGRPVTVLHPGFWNTGPGPDFRGAIVRVGSAPACAGDIEVDCRLSGWTAHGHASNPAYRNVVLRAVWDGPEECLEPPVLPLRPFLDGPWSEIASWLETDGPSGPAPSDAGKCCAPLRTLPLGQAVEVLCQAGRERLRRKAVEMAAQARHMGWEGAFWCAAFGALGYQHNVWPMRRLAELVAAPPRACLPAGAIVWEARLLGLAGLLPAERPATVWADRWRSLWDAWWRERDFWGADTLPAGAWRLSGVRPANHPRRRLALAAEWLVAADLPRRCADWLSVPQSDEAAISDWRAVVSGASPKPAPLGAARATDIAVNAALPWLLARARAGGNGAAADVVERRFCAWPESEDNAALRRARLRLWGRLRSDLPRTAAVQQGFLQITRDFCDPSGALCEGCRFSDLIRGVGAHAP